MKPSFLLLVVIFLTFSVCMTAHANGGGKGYVDWTNGVVTAIGYGEVLQEIQTEENRLATFRLAEKAALRALQETVKDVRIDSATTVADLMRTNNIIGDRVEAVLQSAVVTNREILDIAGAPLAAVEMRICLTSRSPECAQKPALLSEIYREQRDTSLSVSEPDSKTQSVLSTAQADAFPVGWKPARYDTSRPVTGAIIIVVGCSFEKEDFPVVVTGENKSKTIYSVKSVDPQIVRTHGVVRYAVSMEEAMGIGIVGDNPTVIMSLGANNDNQIIIHPNDALALQESSSNGNDYFKNARVVVVK